MGRKSIVLVKIFFPLLIISLILLSDIVEQEEKMIFASMIMIESDEWQEGMHHAVFVTCRPVSDFPHSEFRLGCAAVLIANFPLQLYLMRRKKKI
ncbi:MAG TPA: hypothetical protein DIT25_01960 [Candidatus Moranbacteria bacterium]|nr:hypothetical protein [Candidatus Moranbacteria bacterium]